MTPEAHSVGSREAAIAIAESGWWKGRTHREIAQFQLFIKELCCPFDVFHEALEKSLGRPVWTHELGLNLQGIIKEFLGEAPAPSFEDIISLIPAEKCIVVQVP
jgi:hypothetical protein